MVKKLKDLGSRELLREIIRILKRIEKEVKRK